MSTRLPFFNMTLGALLARVALLSLAIMWTIPTLGLLVSSFRDKDDIIASGWWNALQTSTTNSQVRTGTVEDMMEENGLYVISGDAFTEETSKTIQSFGGGFLPANEALENRDQTGIADYMQRAKQSAWMTAHHLR